MTTTQDPVHPETVCPLRIAIDGIELKCPVRGDHTIHRYRSRTGKRFEIEFVDLEDSTW